MTMVNQIKITPKTLHLPGQSTSPVLSRFFDLWKLSGQKAEVTEL